MNNRILVPTKMLLKRAYLTLLCVTFMQKHCLVPYHSRSGGSSCNACNSAIDAVRASGHHSSFLISFSVTGEML